MKKIIITIGLLVLANSLFAQITWSPTDKNVEFFGGYHYYITVVPNDLELETLARKGLNFVSDHYYRFDDVDTYVAIFYDVDFVTSMLYVISETPLSTDEVIRLKAVMKGDD